MSTSIATCIIKDDPDAITCIEVCDDDEDDWHRQIVLAMENYSTVEDHSVLVELMSAYICSFKTETKDFSKLKLKNLLIKHINNLYLYKSAINDKCNDEYMNKMVEIVTFLCNLEMESMCKDDKNIDVAQRILNYLNLYLYGSEMYIEHVLMKLKPIKRLVLAHVFRYFFKKYEVEDSSDEGFCREYILLLKWKEIDPQEATQSTINAILYNLYKKTSDSIQENDFLRNILMPSYESSTDVLLHILNSTSSLVNKYFEFKSNKSKENNLLIQMADGSDDDITEVNIMGMSNFTINETNESQNEIPLTENNEVEAVGPWENIEHDKNESESEQVLFPDSFNNNPNWITEQVTEIKPENPDTPPATPAPEPENQDQVDEATIQAKDIADNDDYDDNNKNNEHNNHLTTVTTITEKVINNNNNNNNKLNDINESDVVVESVIQECITSNDHVSFHDEVEIETSELKTNNNNNNNNNHNHHSDTDFEGSDSGCGSDGSPKSESDEQLNHNDESLNLPTIVPNTFDFKNNQKNEVFNKIEIEKNDVYRKMNLPSKKRKLSVVNQHLELEEEMLKLVETNAKEEKQVAYPAHRMMNIAELELLEANTSFLKEYINTIEDEWYKKINRQFIQYSQINNSHELIALMENYITALNTETKSFCKYKLKESMLNHIENIYLSQLAINPKEKEKYLSKMQEILKFYCKLEIECSIERNMEMTQRLTKFLLIYLFEESTSIQQVLKKLKSNSFTTPVQLLKYFVLNNLIKSKQDKQNVEERCTQLATVNILSNSISVPFNGNDHSNYPNIFPTIEETKKNNSNNSFFANQDDNFSVITNFDSLNLPTIVPNTFDFKNSEKNEVFNKIEIEENDVDRETNLPLKKRKLFVVNEDLELEEEMLKFVEEKQVCYPAQRMTNIAELEAKALNLDKLNYLNSRPFKSPIGREKVPQEIQPLPNNTQSCPNVTTI